MFRPKGITTTKMDIDFCEKYDMFPRGGVVLCAVSGGKDSMYLVEKLRELAPQYGFELCCAHFNHRLRGEESERDSRFVSDYCGKLKIPLFIGAGDVSAFAAENGLGIEEAARTLRYEFLEKTADEIGAVRIATAHTADDNAETMLFNLCRGSGLRGLCGIPPVRGRIIRPMLQTATSEVYKYLEEKGIPHVEDSTNMKDEFTRNRIRHRVVPELRDLNPGFDESLIRCLASLREDEEFLSGLAQSFLASRYCDKTLPAAEFSALPEPVSARVLQLIVTSGLSRAHIDAVRNIASGTERHAYADIPGLRVVREYDKLIFGSASPSDLPKRQVKIGEITDIPEAGLKISCEFIKNCKEVHNSFNIFFFKNDSICGNMFVMSRLEGEKIRLAGRNCTKTLKKLFSEARLNGENKSLVPVLYDEVGPIAIYGLGIAERCSPISGDSVIKVEFSSVSTDII